MRGGRRPPGADRRTARRLGGVALVVGAALGAACGGETGDGSDTRITVFAAASLGGVMNDLADRFEAESGVEVEVSVAGSSTLRLQLDEGARADVFASADRRQIGLLEVPIDGEPVIVATTRLVVAHRVDGESIGLDRFDDDELLLGACAVQVPCGTYAESAFLAADIEPALDTRETDVRAVAVKVAEGELDAGIVYLTDVIADDRLSSVPIEPEIEIEYPVVRLVDSADAAADFIDFLGTPTARQVFEQRGFETP